MTTVSTTADTRTAHFKDDGLARLADAANVAQFVSFAPGTEPAVRHWRIFDDPDLEHQTVAGSIDTLLARSVDRSVNVRSFLPEQPKSHDFIYGLRSRDDAAAEVRRLAESGLYTIVNETIDIDDGGVSGVSSSGLLEFAPGDTPRAVEKPGTVVLSREIALALLETVYGFHVDLPDSADLRIEFSIHPLKRGYRHGHTIIWEEERVEQLRLSVPTTWPNRFSRFLGDKTFGLLVADAHGAAVPRTTVVARRVAPFSFGESTGSHEYWIRTSPVEQVPGRYTTKKGWLDPFALLEKEDPSREAIASVLAQEAVEARFSGAAAGTPEDELIIEGVAGEGVTFMQGELPPQSLPDSVREDVVDAHRMLKSKLGSVRFEWVHDGRQVWIVQLHVGALPSSGRMIYPGTPAMEHAFQVSDGLEALRRLLSTIDPAKDGVVLIGDVGVTSHLGDVLRRARVPSRIATAP